MARNQAARWPLPQQRARSDQQQGTPGGRLVIFSELEGSEAEAACLQTQFSAACRSHCSLCLDNRPHILQGNVAPFHVWG
jgi:hypothetical protein